MRMVWSLRKFVAGIFLWEICLFPVFPGKYDTGNFEIFSAGLILKVGEIDFEKCGQIAI